MRRLIPVLCTLLCAISGCQTAPNVINYHYKVPADTVPDGAIVTILQTKNGFDAFDNDTTAVLVDYSKLSVSYFHFTGNPPAASDPLVLEWNAIGSDTAVDTNLPNVVTAMRIDTSPNLPMGQRFPNLPPIRPDRRRPWLNGRKPAAGGRPWSPSCHPRTGAQSSSATLMGCPTPSLPSPSIGPRAPSRRRSIAGLRCCAPPSKPPNGSSARR